MPVYADNNGAAAEAIGVIICAWSPSFFPPAAGSSSSSSLLGSRVVDFHDPALNFFLP